MARHKQPREIAELKGAPKHDPQRYRGDPPKADLPLGNAPDHMKPGAKKCWFEISSYAPPQVLTGAERIMLELASTLLAKFRGWDKPEHIEQWVFTVGELGQLVGLLARFGMSPADRQKLAIEKPKESNPFANLEQ